MRRILLLYQTEGAAVLKREIAGFGLQVDTASLSDADAALSQPDIDAVIVEAAANLEETRGLLESPARPQRAPVILLLRAGQVAGIDPTWPLDDFLVLPTMADELILRLRRAAWKRTGVDEGNVIRSGELALDLANYKVFVGQQPVSLTFKEFELLRFLMMNRGKVFTREALLNRVWGYEYYGGARTVDVHIRRLRSKIETGAAVYIETVRNVGYRFPAER
jgi:DNA-binding response OmpR family regulator